MPFTIAAAFIRITQPTAGSNWGFGTTRRQTWTTNLGALDLVNVQLSTNGIGGSYSTLTGGANVVATAKAANVITPSTATTTARLKVVWANPPGGSSASSDNPGNFTLAPPFITVTSPKAGDAWAIGASRTIAWSNNLGTAENVEIRLSKDDGSTYPIVIAGGTPSDGKQAVTVAAGWGTQTTTRIKVTWLANAAILGVSSSFAIQ
jgi:hypothetical protein